MPRIYKGNDTTLRLLIHTCTYEGTISDLKISLYTNDPSIAIEFTDRYTIDGNIVSLDIPNWAFGSMEDGVINYVAQGMIDDDTFLTERQSNYFLKTPANYTPTPMPEEVVLGELTTMIVENGVFEYTPTDVDAWNKATIEVNVPQEGGCNLGEGEIYLTANDAGFYELYAADDGYDGWSKFYVTLENGGAIKIHKAEELIQGLWGIDYGAYYYVGGKITDIQEINTQYGNATYTLDNGFSVYRGKWMDDNPFWSEDQIKVGAYIVVYGIIQNNNGILRLKSGSQVIAYQECEGGEIVSCNLEDKWVTPSMGDRDGNGLIVVEESEGFDGLSRVVIDPTTIYNEGVSAGKIEGGDLTIGTGDIFLSVNDRGQRFEILPSEWEYDAFDKFIVEMENFDLGDTNIYDALSVNQLLMDGVISYNNNYIFKGEITEIQRIRPEYGDARYTLDGSLNVYNGQTMGYDLQVGDNVIVYGTLSEYNGAPQFSAGSEIKALWREGGSCNLEDKGVNPSINDRDGNGLIVITPSENYDGLLRVVLDPTTIYNEGVEEGRSQGGGSGDCNIQGNKTVELDGEKMGIYPDEGYDGIFEVIVEAGQKAEEWREAGRNEVRDKLQSIEITENGRYSAEDQIYVESLKYNGGYHTDTISTYDINRIEVTFKADTSESINIQGQPFILGGSLYGLEDVNGTDNACARAIQYAFGRIVGYWEGKWTEAAPTSDREWTTITLDANGMTIKYPTSESYMEYTHDNGHTNDGGDIFPFIIGGEGIRAVGENGNYTASLVEDTQFRGLIKEVKINTNSMGEITYIPNDGGYGVWNRKVENTGEYLSALEPTEGTVTMNGDWERKYGEGWKEINVNIPTIQDSAKDYYYCPLILGDTGFGEAAKSWDADMVIFNDSDGNIIEDKLYIPTYGNRNEFRTKTKAKFVQRLPNDVSIFGSMEFGDGVEYFVTSEGKQFTNLTDLTIGTDMNTVNFGPSTFPILKRIWCFSETDNIDVYFSMGSSFYETGTLYLKNHNQETEWKNSLPSGWTIVLL